MIIVHVQQEMLQKLIELQQDLVGIDSLLQPNRVCCSFFVCSVPALGLLEFISLSRSSLTLVRWL